MGSQAWDLLDVFSINSLLKLIKNCLKLLSNENNKLIVYSKTKEVFSLKNKLQSKKRNRSLLQGRQTSIWPQWDVVFHEIPLHTYSIGQWLRFDNAWIMHTFKAYEYNPLHELCKFYCKWRIWKIFVCIQLFHLLSDNKHEFKTKQMLLNYFTI